MRVSRETSRTIGASKMHLARKSAVVSHMQIARVISHVGITHANCTCDVRLWVSHMQIARVIWYVGITHANCTCDLARWNHACKLHVSFGAWVSLSKLRHGERVERPDRFLVARLACAPAACELNEVISSLSNARFGFRFG